MIAKKFSLHSPWIFFGSLLLYSALLLPSIGRQGISWDEQNDLWVAQSYLASPGGWLTGSEVDPSQTRLPMAVVAVIYELIGISDLITARVVSCFVGGLTLLAVYLYCKQQYAQFTGILACLLLATSPFFLSFARVAFTETDIYLACAFAWLLVSVAQFRARPTLGWAAVVGILLGLALSAKFTAVVILPAVWYAIVQNKLSDPERNLPRVKDSTIIFWIVWLLICTICGVIAGQKIHSASELSSSRLILYCFVLAGWLAPLVWSMLHRSSTTSRKTSAFFVTGLALLTFLVLPPEHLTNPAILQSLWWRAGHEMAFNLGFLFEAAGLHVGSLIFKSSPLIGAGLLISLLLTASQWKDRLEVHFPILLVSFYFGGLILLPLAQTFYIIPLLPLLAIFAADQSLRLFAKRRSAALVLAGLAVILWGIDMAFSYPDYNLNGYQWLGERVIAGRSSVGYRSIIQTPSDGVEQVITWLNGHAQPGDRVRSYLLETHIIQAVAPHPAYQIENGFANPKPNPDYVVVEINIQVQQSWWTDPSSGNVFRPPYDPEWLEDNYQRMFTVRRAFGIEMASVWKKK